MDTLLIIIAFLCGCVGILGSIIPGLPGPPLSYVGLLCIHFTEGGEFSTSTLLIWAVITLVVTALDFYLPAFMTRRFGGTRAGAIGATVGVFVGLLFPPFGIFFGPFFGAVLGELTQNKKDAGQAFKSGFGSFLAFLVGTGLKFITTVWMLLMIIGECREPLAETFSALWNWIVNLF